MAEFTMELKDVIENVFGDSLDPTDWEQPYQDYTYQGIVYRHLATVPDWDKIGLGYYPIFDEAYRPILNGKIVDTFFRREIGTETIDMWQWMIRSKMQNIMPYYNKLYLTEKIPYNALDTMRIESEREDTANNTEDGNASTKVTGDVTASARSVTSSTPQTMLAADEDYATGANDSNSQTHNTNDSESTSNSVAELKNNGTSLVTGYQGAASDLVTKYRSTLLNIDMMVMNELQDQFMGILNSSDDYTQGNGYLSW